MRVVSGVGDVVMLMVACGDATGSPPDGGADASDRRVPDGSSDADADLDTGTCTPSWSVETIGMPTSGDFSLAVGPDGKAHLAYYDSAAGGLLHRERGDDLHVVCGTYTGLRYAHASCR